MESQPNNPLHGINLKSILTYLIEEKGWDEMAENVSINCFKNNQTIGSSLKFLRRTPWAREKVERYYLKCISKK